MATRAAEVNTIVPALSAERPVTWPKRTRAKLSNGLEVILAESHTIPKFHGELFFRSGNAAAIDRGPGLAEMTAFEPTTTRTSLVSAGELGGATPEGALSVLGAALSIYAAWSDLQEHRKLKAAFDALGALGFVPGVGEAAGLLSLAGNLLGGATNYVASVWNAYIGLSGSVMPFGAKPMFGESYVQNPVIY